MSNYLCKVGFIPALGSVDPFVVTESSMETKEEYAIWYLNTMYDHDGLPRCSKLPCDTTFKLIEDGYDK
jgi:hypothetical protein